ncbi:MAG: hypothetical protein QOI91_270 [Solirubrobacteraceae bacterium]|jgi:hypothetical protein|nr:hypothetical protein [Solirubrobacteraceae bacterium]
MAYSGFRARGARPACGTAVANSLQTPGIAVFTGFEPIAPISPRKKPANMSQFEPGAIPGFRLKGPRTRAKCAKARSSGRPCWERIAVWPLQNRCRTGRILCSRYCSRSLATSTPELPCERNPAVRLVEWRAPARLALLDSSRSSAKQRCSAARYVAIVGASRPTSCVPCRRRRRRTSACGVSPVVRHQTTSTFGKPGCWCRVPRSHGTQSEPDYRDAFDVLCTFWDELRTDSLTSQIGLVKVG